MNFLLCRQFIHFAGIPTFGTSSTLQPGFSQPPFGQATPSSLTPSSHSSGHSSHSSGAFAPGASSSGFPTPTGPSGAFDSSSNFPAAPPPPPQSTATSFGSTVPSHSTGFGHSSHSSHPSSHGTGGTGFGSGSQSGAPFAGPSASPNSFTGSLPSSGFIGGNDGSIGNNQGNNQFGSNNQGQFSGSNNDDGSGNGDYSAIPGIAGADYPIFAEIPRTSFDCKTQAFPGYYADVEAQCQVFHVCALNRTYDFLCPNGTIFSQESLVCVWWNQFDCQSAPGLFGNNAYIYDYSKNGQQSNSGNNGGFQSQGGNAGSGFSGIFDLPIRNCLG